MSTGVVGWELRSHTFFSLVTLLQQLDFHFNFYV